MRVRHSALYPQAPPPAATTAAVIYRALTAIGSTYTDFTLSGFGTPSAALVFLNTASRVSNPGTSFSHSIGFWDGTNQRCMMVSAEDNVADSNTFRLQCDNRIAVRVSPTTGSRLNGFTISNTTDGVRLTMADDASTAELYCTVLLLKGVSAAVGTLNAADTQDTSVATASLGFAPKLAFVTTVGDQASTINAATPTATAVLSFGVADLVGDVQRSIRWISNDAAANTTNAVFFSETMVGGQTGTGTDGWALDASASGNTLVLHTRDANASDDLIFYLALGGTGLSYDLGTLTTPTSTGNNVNATDVDADALLVYASMATSTTRSSSAEANCLAVGLADAMGQYSHTVVDEYNAATTNCESVSSATTLIDIDTSSGGTRSDLITGSVTLNSNDFTINYTAVDATARKGWWVAFGPAATTTARAPFPIRTVQAPHDVARHFGV